MNLSLLRSLLQGEWRAHPVRAVVALAAIALGVALGYGIDLINSAAFNEFSAAARSLSGSADLQVRAQAPQFDEAGYALVSNMPEVAVVSPVLELDSAVAGQRSSLKIIGIDSFQAAAISPDLLGVPDAGKPFDALMADTVFLSPAALQWLHLKNGDSLHLRSGTRDITLRIAGTLVRARAGQRLAVMDIASAQWHFDKTGLLSRMDIKLVDGVNRSAFRAALSKQLAAGLIITEAADQDQRTANMSRAYRVNLNVLAMVALFTGAFLVFSTQALSVLRRRPQFALLRVMGTTRRQLLLQVLTEGALLGIGGSLLGLLLGTLMASAALSAFGGDLGGGYFPGIQPALSFNLSVALAFFFGGSGVAVLGSLSPALEAAHAKPAAALKAGSEDLALSPLTTPWPALIAIATGALLTQLPPVADLPLFGYLAIVLLLVGSIALMPRAAGLVFSALGRRWRGIITGLTLARLANAPNQASIALSGVLASFSLMVAMAIMVSSFRVSVDDWLQHLLSADIYVRMAAAGENSVLNPDEQARIAGLPGVARAERSRNLFLTLDPTRPAVTLIARSLNSGSAEQVLPLVGGSLTGIARPIWMSEAMVDLYGWQTGQQVMLPLGGQLHAFTVAGIWRDYARQSGSLQIRLTDYQALSGDLMANDMALWMARGSGMVRLRQQLQALPFAGLLEFAEPGEIRALSLKIFDRSFAITYLLEGVAIIIGLFGIAATFSAQTLARAREFGMLRHVGVTRRQILMLLAGEGALLAAMAIAAGFLLGWCISLILVFIVNPQSFHWTMQLHMPWGLLITVASVLLVSAALTALVSGRLAVAGSAVRAVREDW
jgi:putative ABC transport system permease protein